MLERLPFTLAVARLDPREGWPSWATYSSFVSVTRSDRETSVVCEDHLVPLGLRAERGFTAFRVAGTLDFALTGVLSELARPVATAGVSCFAVSTYDTDYVLVKTEDAARAIEAWAASGTTIRELTR